VRREIDVVAQDEDGLVLLAAVQRHLHEVAVLAPRALVEEFDGVRAGEQLEGARAVKRRRAVLAPVDGPLGERLRPLFVGAVLLDRLGRLAVQSGLVGVADGNDLENGRRLFTIGAIVNGEILAEGKAYNKKDASQIAARLVVEKLGIGKEMEAD
jgi:hypothetical protein